MASNPTASAGDGSSSSEVWERVQKDFERLGVSGYEARVLIALMRLGTANATQLARATGIQRPNVYPVLAELRAKGLADSSPGKAAVWRTLGPEETLDRLYSWHEQTLRELQARRDETRDLLVANLKPDEPSTSLSFIDLLPSAVQAKRTYERLLQEAQSEVLVFNQAPYLWADNEVNPAIIDMVSRGTAARALYEARQMDAPDEVAFRRQHEVYMDNGVQARVVDELPFKLMVVDRRSTLVSLADPVNPNSGYPTLISVEHPGFARGQAACFEYYWAMGRPYTRLDDKARATQRAR